MTTSPRALAAALVRAGLAPDVAAGCSVKRDGVWRSAVGGDVDVLFDLASLTKPMTAVAVALAALTVPRDARLVELLPELRGTASEGASVELLLSHRAGLHGHLALFEPLTRALPVDLSAALRHAADSRREDARGLYSAGGFDPVYSDLGYALVGHALARRTGWRDAGEAVERLVVSPLGLRGTLGTARDLEACGVDVQRAAAPTETVAWRGGVVQGRVHDENAWALTGKGGSGHAGLFGTVTAVLRFGEAFLDGLGGGGLLNSSRSADFHWLVAKRPGGTLRAGFDGKSEQGSSAGERFGPRSFGHLGFTGTSLWVDPDAGVVAALLTNRVWPDRERAREAIRQARPAAHDALHAYATGELQ